MHAHIDAEKTRGKAMVGKTSKELYPGAQSKAPGSAEFNKAFPALGGKKTPPKTELPPHMTADELNKLHHDHPDAFADQWRDCLLR